MLICETCERSSPSQAKLSEHRRCNGDKELICVIGLFKSSRFKQNYRLICDIKVLNMLLGIQRWSSMHPCLYCNGYKFDKMGEKTNQKGLWLKGEPRTMKSLLEDYQKRALETNSNRKMLK